MKKSVKTVNFSLKSMKNHRSSSSSATVVKRNGEDGFRRAFTISSTIALIVASFDIDMTFEWIHYVEYDDDTSRTT